MDDGELRELADNILAEMYAKAEPPINYRRLRENPEEAEKGWYNNHYLPDEEQRAIFDKHVEHRDLTGNEHAALVMECIVNLGPAVTPPDGDSDD